MTDPTPPAAEENVPPRPSEEMATPAPPERGAAAAAMQFATAGSASAAAGPDAGPPADKVPGSGSNGGGAGDGAADCIDLEDLALFAEGTLPAGELPRVIAHLATCAACFEIVAGVSHFLADERQEAADGAAADRSTIAAAAERAPHAVAPPASPDTETDIGSDPDTAAAAQPAAAGAATSPRPATPLAGPKEPGRWRRGDRGRDAAAHPAAGYLDTAYDPAAQGRLKAPRNARRWLAAAAVALLVPGALVFARLYFSQPTGSATPDLVAMTQAGGIAGDAYGGVTRGGSDSSDDGRDEISEYQAFRFGVSHFDLWLALSAGKKDQAEKSASKVNRVIEKTDLVPEDFRHAFSQIGQDLANDKPLAALVPTLAHKQDEVAHVYDSTWVGLGAWAEACRRSTWPARDLFESRATRRMIDKAIEQVPQPPAPASPLTSAPLPAESDATTADAARESAVAKTLADIRRTLASDLHGVDLALTMQPLCKRLLADLYPED